MSVLREAFVPEQSKRRDRFVETEDGERTRIGGKNLTRLAVGQFVFRPKS